MVEHSSAASSSARPTPKSRSSASPTRRPIAVLDELRGSRRRPSANRRVRATRSTSRPRSTSALRSDGELLLLLNDDIEVVDPGLDRAHGDVSAAAGDRRGRRPPDPRGRKAPARRRPLRERACLGTSTTASAATSSATPTMSPRPELPRGHRRLHDDPRATSSRRSAASRPSSRSTTTTSTTACKLRQLRSAGRLRPRHDHVSLRVLQPLLRRRRVGEAGAAGEMGRGDRGDPAESPYLVNGTPTVRTHFAWAARRFPPLSRLA